MGSKLGNAVIAQSGGPTAVINQSLVGVIEGIRRYGGADRVFGARNGVRGMVEDRFVDLTDAPASLLEDVAGTPSAALGSSRDKPDAAYCERIFETLRVRDIRSVFYIGGNDSADTCRIMNELSTASGYELRCFHVPKTIDNDLEENDHTPGFASAARYVGLAFMGDQLDNRSLPGIKINVVMGRHAGFLTAAAALMRDRRADDGPHLIYVPESPIDIERITVDVDRVYSRLGRCQVAISEGIQDRDGTTIGAQLIAGDVDAHGNVQLSGSGALGDNLASLLKSALTPKGGKPPRVRADTLGYPQRCYPDASVVDQREAREVGRFAVELAVGGERDGSITINRSPGEPYTVRYERVALDRVARKTRHMPPEFLEGHSDVSDAYVSWLRPLVGDVPRVGRL